MNGVNGIRALTAGPDIWKKGLWMLLALAGATIIAAAITDEKWIYLLLLAAPIAVYLSLMRTIIFPLGVYCALLPFDSLLDLTGGATLTRFIAILTILTLFFKGIFERKLLEPKIASLWMALFVVYAAVSSFWAIDPRQAVSLLPTAGGLLLLYLLVASYRFTRQDFSVLTFFVLAGGFLAAVITVFAMRAAYAHAEIQRITLVVGDRATHVNLLGFVLLFPVAICMKYVIEQKRTGLRILCGGMLLVLLAGIVLTGSRGNMLAVGVIFVTYVLALRRRSVWVVIVCVLIMLAAFVPGTVMERWQDAVATGGTGRVSIWKAGLQSLGEYWTLGAGLNNFPNVYSEFGHFTPESPTKMLYKGSHNIYVGLLVELGVLGFIVFAVGLWRHYKLIERSVSLPVLEKVMLKAGFFGVLTASFFLHTIWTKSFWLVLMLIVAYGNTGGRLSGGERALKALQSRPQRRMALPGDAPGAVYDRERRG